MNEKIKKNLSEEEVVVKINGIKDVISSIGMLLVEMDSDGKILDLNDFASKSLGYPQGELRGKNWFDVFYPGERHVKIGEFKEKTAGLKPAAFEESENEIVCGDREKRIFRWKILATSGKNGEKRIISFGEDVTKDRLSERIFKTLAERKPLQAMESILPHLRGFFHFDRVSLGISTAENSFRLISQYTSEDAEESFREMNAKVHENGGTFDLEIRKGDLLDRVLKTDKIGYTPEFSESSFRRDDVRAECGWHSRLVVPLVFTEKLKIFLSFLSRTPDPINEGDLKFIEKIKPSLAAIAETWYFEEKMNRLSKIDFLTGIFNRSCIAETVKREISAAERNKTAFSVSMLDIDDFKKFNDTYGHDAGDSILMDFSRTVKTNLRTGDVFGRYGGDEFLIVFPGTPGRTAAKALRRISEIVSSSGIFSGEKVGFSAGIAEFRTADSVSSLLKRADTALYESKKNGKGKIAFTC